MVECEREYRGRSVGECLRRLCGRADRVLCQVLEAVGKPRTQELEWLREQLIERCSVLRENLSSPDEEETDVSYAARMTLYELQRWVAECNRMLSRPLKDGLVEP